MNIGYTPNYQMNNANNTSFGMALEIRGKAMKRMKKELSKLPEADGKNFWSTVKDIGDRQATNPVDIIVKKGFFRGLYAMVVDNGRNAVKALKVKRRPWEGKGNAKFLERAEHEANMINEANQEVANMVNITVS